MQRILMPFVVDSCTKCSIPPIWVNWRKDLSFNLANDARDKFKSTVIWAVAGPKQCILLNHIHAEKQAQQLIRESKNHLIGTFRCRAHGNSEIENEIIYGNRCTLVHLHTDDFTERSPQTSLTACVEHDRTIYICVKLAVCVCVCIRTTVIMCNKTINRINCRNYYFASISRAWWNTKTLICCIKTNQE